MEIVPELISPIIQFALVVLAGWFAAKIIPLIEAWIDAKLNKLEAMPNDLLYNVACQIVMAAEQFLKDSDGQVRREWAIQQLEAWLTKHGLELDLDEASLLIEAAVFDMINRIKPEAGPAIMP